MFVDGFCAMTSLRRTKNTRKVSRKGFRALAIARRQSSGDGDKEKMPARVKTVSSLANTLLPSLCFESKVCASLSHGSPRLVYTRHNHSRQRSLHFVPLPILSSYESIYRLNINGARKRRTNPMMLTTGIMPVSWLFRRTRGISIP